jgi:hypothetical protein
MLQSTDFLALLSLLLPGYIHAAMELLKVIMGVTPCPTQSCSCLLLLTSPSARSTKETVACVTTSDRDHIPVKNDISCPLKSRIYTTTRISYPHYIYITGLSFFPTSKFNNIIMLKNSVIRGIQSRQQATIICVPKIDEVLKYRGSSVMHA